MHTNNSQQNRSARNWPVRLPPESVPGQLLAPKSSLETEKSGHNIPHRVLILSQDILRGVDQLLVLSVSAAPLIKMNRDVHDNMIRGVAQRKVGANLVRSGSGNVR